jgi:cyanate permease
VVSGLLFSTIILPVAFLDNIRTSIVLLLLSCFSFGTYTSNHWAITQTLAGPLAAGRWTGIQNGFGNLSGIIASWLTGYLVQRTGSFHSAFVIASLVAVTGALMWGVVVKSVKEVDWV